MGSERQIWLKWKVCEQIQPMTPSFSVPSVIGIGADAGNDQYGRELVKITVTRH